MARNARSGERIGSWKGKGVYSVSKKEYMASSNDAKKRTDRCFVIYDDGMKFVYQNEVVGTLLESGSVQDVHTRYEYIKLRDTWDTEKYKWNEKTGYYEEKKNSNEKVVKKVPASGYSETVSNDEFFSKLDREINELLADVDSWKMPEVKLDLGV